MKVTGLIAKNAGQIQPPAAQLFSCAYDDAVHRIRIAVRRFGRSVFDAQSDQAPILADFTASR